MGLTLVSAGTGHVRSGMWGKNSPLLASLTPRHAKTLQFIFLLPDGLRLRSEGHSGQTAERTILKSLNSRLQPLNTAVPCPPCDTGVTFEPPFRAPRYVAE